ncbi:transporter substrate-binding domain-containing protein [Desulfolutivibrio sulfoxidireducens]|nr:transporter substrate-binding domain-containing protein [Desulfolutivibrio sulfoxidireducens]
MVRIRPGPPRKGSDALREQPWRSTKIPTCSRDSPMQILQETKRFASTIAVLFWLLTPPAQAGEPLRTMLRSASELDYPPFALVMPDGRAAGFSVDLLRAVAQAAHMEVTFEVGPWHSIKQKLADGQLDVLPFMSYSKERENHYDFSIPYLRMHGTIFVRKDEKHIHGERDLKDKEVIVMRGDTAHEYALKKNLSHNLILTDSYAEAMRLLSDGKHDAVIVQQLTGWQIIKHLGITNLVDVGSNRDEDFKISREPLSGFEQKFCIAVKKGNHDLLAKLNEGLAIVIANGTYDKLYATWFEPILQSKALETMQLIKYFFIIFIPILSITGLVGMIYLRKEVARKTLKLKQEIEERNKTEDALRNSEERLQFVLLGSQLGYWDWDIQTNEVKRNMQWAQMLEYTLEDIEFTVKQWIDFIHPDDRDAAQRSIQDHLAGKTPMHKAEYRMITKSGQYKWILDQAKVVKYDSSGKPIRMCGTHTDITERKRIEEALRESEAKLEAALSSMADAVFISDSKGHFINFNDAFATFHRFKNKDECATTLAEYPDVLDVFLDTGEPAPMDRWAVPRALKGETATNAEYILRRKDTGETWIGSYSFSPIRNEDGEVVGSVVVGRDITERKRQEDAIRKSEHEFRLLAEAMPQIVWVSDPDGMNIYLNKKWMEYTGQTLEESHDAGWRTPLHPEDKQRYLDAWRQAISNKSEFAVECRLRRHDGEYKWWLIRGVPILDEQGSLLKLFGTCTDIDNLKQAEAMLLQAKLAADAANRSKSEFLANMSHEIRTPLNGLLGMLQLLATTKQTDEQQEYVRTAINSSYRLTRLLADILDISRVEAGKMPILQAEFSLDCLKESILELFGPTAREHGLDFDFVLDAHIPVRLIGDEARVRQILFNLVGNALKFTEQGHVRVEVAQLSRVSPTTIRILFTVSDTGIGISDTELKNIFEPFAQAEGSYTRRFQGAGLGLSIVRKLIALMDGELAIDNTPGEGTTMYVSLPFELPVTAKERSERGAADHAPPPEPLRILFAEDDEISLFSGTKLLEKSGYAVVAAMDGQEALNRLSEQHFDLILMDIQMPVLDGVKATQAIRRATDLGAKANIPIIAMTAYAMTGDREKFLAAGMNDYLSKPVDIASLREVIGRVLSRPEASN